MTARRHIAHVGGENATLASRGDAGLDVLEPLLGSICGASKGVRTRPADHQIDLLYNEETKGASAYPLKLSRGEYFSEALGPANPDAQEYEDLIVASLALLREHSLFRPMSLDALYRCGRAIQELDRAFASSRIGQPLDSLHRCVGTDARHPYAKITVCRTAFPVEISGKTVQFFFEKFLVAYSYLDEFGKRRSTITPAHSHPINFETGYFTHFGEGSAAVEQEFILTDANGTALVDADNKVSAAFGSRLDWNALRVLRAEPGPKLWITPEANPAPLAAFASEAALHADEARVMRFDGLFRPHRVEVIDDPLVETRYFALDNYFGPACRVLVFDESGAVTKWRRNEWVGR